MSDGSERLAFVIGIDGLSCVLHHQQVVLLCNFHDTVHVASDTGIMDGDNDLRPRRYQGLDLLRINVGITLHTVGEDNLRPMADESQSGRHESITGNNDLVTRLDIAQDSSHLQGVGAAGRQQAFLEAVFLFKEPLAALGELTVATQFAVIHGLIHIMGFLSGKMGLVKGDLHNQC